MRPTRLARSADAGTKSSAAGPPATSSAIAAVLCAQTSAPIPPPMMIAEVTPTARGHRRVPRERR
ncbi:MAG: hypothetical protein KC486_24275 [Myxococcales bacterium]|nr:hypothetical protein [Myxococcales bacterium]